MTIARPAPPPGRDAAVLLVFSGLPGVGKSSAARLVASRLRAAWLRMDTIEQALARAGATTADGSEGYVVAYGLAADNLRLGLDVVADCVNASEASRAAWQRVAAEQGAHCLRVHLVCSDAAEHRRRVGARQPDIAGQVLPTWEQIERLRFDPLADGALVVDTCGASPEGVAEQILGMVAQARRPLKQHK